MSSSSGGDVAVEPELKGGGGPGGDAGAEEVVVVGPNSGRKSESARYDRPVGGIARYTRQSLALEGGVNGCLDNRSIRLDGEEAL